jgi:two-component system C4-dicarboxylate transport sensor histidine kinase DctB
VGFFEPVAARYRLTIALNLGVMGLALLLGGFAVQQARRRERLEAAAREEARVRELERQLFHAERLTTVGRLAAGIAHEINNPLEGMANYLALAREALARGEVAAGERHLAQVREGLERAAAIVRQVLAHADPAKAPVTPLDLNQVLREMGRFVRSRKEFGAISLGLDLADGPLLVRGSPVMLGQVAVNLILIACEAQPRGGEVRVASRREEGFAVAEFADRGPGVPEPDRERIFEPFYSTKDSTGLGLSICHSIVRQHGGELSVSPREGGGALFRLRLPALEA